MKRGRLPIKCDYGQLIYSVAPWITDEEELLLIGLCPECETVVKITVPVSDLNKICMRLNTKRLEQRIKQEIERISEDLERVAPEKHKVLQWKARTQ